MNSLALIIGLITILSTLAGGWFAMHLKDKLHLILGFSAGAVIGVAFFDLLPESIGLATKTYDISLATLFVAIGFAIFLILDRLFSLHFHEEEECDIKNHRGKLAATALCFHSLLDGIGIGLAFKVSPSVGWIVAAAVLAHDFSDGINTVSAILHHKGERKQAFRWLIADALAPALGVVATFFFTVPDATLGLILSVFTGFFIYLGASDLIPESHHHHPTLWTTMMTIVGIAVLYVIIHLA
jgi:ZIP family zinc transporter